MVFNNQEQKGILGCADVEFYLAANASGLDGCMSPHVLPPSPGTDTWLDPPPFAFLQPSMQSCDTPAAVLEQVDRTRERAGVCSWDVNQSPTERQMGHLTGK